jgi:hypothetical protein
VYDPATDTWIEGVPLPDFRAALTVSTVNGKIYAIGGTPRQHNCQATSTVYELDLGFPPPDFNGDGVIDGADFSIMVDHWHTDDPLCDIAPAPCGDGIVDVQDLIFLSEHLFKETELTDMSQLDAMNEQIQRVQRSNIQSNTQKKYDDTVNAIIQKIG